jgi:hypothetical protein
LEEDDVRYAVAYANFKTGNFGAAERHLKGLDRADLFEAANELRRTMQACRESECL